MDVTESLARRGITLTVTGPAKHDPTLDHRRKHRDGPGNRRKIAKFIVSSYAQNAIPPTIRQIGHHVCLTNNAVVGHLRIMVRDGTLVRTGNNLNPKHLPVELFNAIRSLATALIEKDTNA